MNRKRIQGGFTLVEAAVAMAIVLILAALAIPSLFRQRPRARLATTTAEVHSLIHTARQQALATGHDVWVLVFPRQATSDGVGRVVVYEDGNFDFATVNAPGGMDLDRFDPVQRAVGPRSQVVNTVDLPSGVTLGTDGSAPATLPAPLAGINLSTGCSFCGPLTDGRGGIRFDARGRASFYGRAGPPTVAQGGALNLTSSPTLQGTRTLVVTPVTGAVRVLTNG
jgi:prepilin-type N-terminal cleavage/methylation domain-containing protein